MLNNYLLLLSMLKTVVLLNMFVETNTIYIYICSFKLKLPFIVETLREWSLNGKLFIYSQHPLCSMVVYFHSLIVFGHVRELPFICFL